jgi:L-ascorbate metabolism protein UlaG (beta-lactamase superfamily)
MKALICVLWLGAFQFAQVNRPVEEFPTTRGPVKITLIRHASLMVEGGGQVIHVDPTSQGNYAGLPQADLILITHSHGDHMDPKLVAQLKKAGTVTLGPEVVAQAIPETTLIAAGGTRTVGQWNVQAVPAYNLKRERAPGRPFHPKGEGVGFVLSYGGKRFYIAGDTEGIPEMKALKEIDVAFLPMNQPYTMLPEEAAEAVRAFQPKIVYPYHCRGTDLAAFQKALAGAATEVRIRDWYY